MLEVKIISPDDQLYSGQAVSVSSTNSLGKFDVLPQHARFLTVIEKNPITIRQTNNELKTFTYPLAILSVQDDQVTIFVNVPYKNFS